MTPGSIGVVNKLNRRDFLKAAALLGAAGLNSPARALEFEEGLRATGMSPHTEYR